jgi:hypothetical protein
LLGPFWLYRESAVAKPKKQESAYEIVNTHQGSRRFPDGTIVLPGANRVPRDAYELVLQHPYLKRLIQLGVLIAREVPAEVTGVWDGELPLPLMVSDLTVESMERVVSKASDEDTLSRWLDQDGRQATRHAILKRVAELRPKKAQSASQPGDEDDEN